MITFFRRPDCRECDVIQEVLEDLCLAHERVSVQAHGRLPRGLPQGSLPPVMVDEGKVIQGGKEILDHLEDLAKIKDLWDKFQTDACYCDEQGNIE